MTHLDKIHKVIAWAAEGLENVSVSQVKVKSHIQFYDQIKTRDIDETVIKPAADLMSEETPDYQYLVARLTILHLRKIAYNQFEQPHLYERVKKLTADGNYDKHILEDYSVEVFDDLEKYIDHWRNMNLTCASVEKMAGKYLVKDRVSKTVYESSQFLYMLVGMCLFASYDKAELLNYVERSYYATSQFKISLPTPIMAGVHTPSRQFSPCVLIECDNS